MSLGQRGLVSVEVGEQVRLNQSYLRGTKRTRTPEAKRIWIVVECECRLCSGGKHAALDETCWVTGGPRHVALANLCRPGEKPRKSRAAKSVDEDLTIDPEMLIVDP